MAFKVYNQFLACQKKGDQRIKKGTQNFYIHPSRLRLGKVNHLMSHRVGRPGDNSQINWECGLRAVSKRNSEK